VAQKSFRCRVITPEAEVLNQTVTSAILPAWDGQLGILPDRAAFVTKLGTGELSLTFPDDTKGKGGDRAFFLDGGFAEMHGDKLTILARHSIPEEQLSLADAESELAAAKAVNLDTLPTTEAKQHARDEIQRLDRKLTAARRFKARGGI